MDISDAQMGETECEVVSSQPLTAKRPRKQLINESFEGEAELKLSVADQEFCAAYLRYGCNAYKAVREVWPEAKPSYQKKKGTDLMKRQSIRMFIAKLQAPQIKSVILSNEEVLEGIQSIAVDTKVWPNVRIQGYGLMAKIKGMLVDRHEVTVKPRRMLIRNEQGTEIERLE